MSTIAALVSHQNVVIWAWWCLQSPAGQLSFDRGIYRWSVDSPHKGPVMQESILCHDVIMTQNKQPPGKDFIRWFD